MKEAPSDKLDREALLGVLRDNPTEVAALLVLARSYEADSSFEAARQAALELLQRVSALRGRPRVDQVGGRFGLDQVELPVQDRAPSELPGCGEPRAGGHQRRHRFGRHEQPAVRRDLDQVLPGVGARRRKAGREHVIDELRGDRMQEVRAARGPGGRARERPQAATRDVERARPRQADHGDGGPAGGRGERHDGIREHGYVRRPCSRRRRRAMRYCWGMLNRFWTA